MTARNTRFTRTLVAAAAFAMASAAPCSAQIVTDRPTFTESAATVPDGRIQVDAGYTFSDFGTTDIHEVGEALVRYGLIPGLELRLGIPSFISVSAFVPDQATGMSDGALGLKLGLYESGVSEGLPSVSLLLGTSVPIGVGDLPDEYKAGGWEPEAKLALGWALTERLGLGANVNYAQRHPRSADGYDEFAASVALGFPLTARLGGFGEFYAIRPDFPGESGDVDVVDGGVTFLVSPDFQLDARVGVELDSPNDAMFFGVGLAKLF